MPRAWRRLRNCWPIWKAALPLRLRRRDLQALRALPRLRRPSRAQASLRNSLLQRARAVHRRSLPLHGNERARRKAPRQLSRPPGYKPLLLPRRVWRPWHPPPCVTSKIHRPGEWTRPQHRRPPLCHRQFPMRRPNPSRGQLPRAKALWMRKSNPSRPRLWRRKNFLGNSWQAPRDGK